MGKIKYQDALSLGLVFFFSPAFETSNKKYFPLLLFPVLLLLLLSSSTPQLSRVAVHTPHLEALKGELLGQHSSEDVCPAQGGSAGAQEPPDLFPWAGEAQKQDSLGVTGDHVQQQPSDPSMGTFETL